VDTTRRRFLGGTLAGALSVATRFAPARALAKRKRGSGSQPLFHDAFKRKNQQGWGRAWFNQRYDRTWSIEGKRAIYRLPPTENRAFYRPNPILVLDHDVVDVDIRATISASNTTGRAGVCARAAGYADYYAAYLGPGDVLRLTRCGSHDEVLIGKFKIPFEADRKYRVRLQVKDTGPVKVRAKAWTIDLPEPSAWQIDELDVAAEAISVAGPFGILVQHATDRRASSFRVSDVTVRSGERPATTSPTIAYSLVGTSIGVLPSMHAVAKSAVPSRITFEMSPEPTFTQSVTTFFAGETGRAQTASTILDYGAYSSSTPVYWRARAERRGAIAYGPVSNMHSPPGVGLPVRFAFGACTRWQTSPHNSFEQAQLKLPNFFLHQGDFGYVPHRVIDHAPDTYQDHWVRMLMDPAVSKLLTEVPFAFYQDDADYGRNLADSHTLRPFTIDAHAELSANPAPYFESRYGDVAFFSLDCRRFSTGKDLPPEERSKLGADQKAWLKSSMQSAADQQMGLLVVASPQAFGSDRSAESWRRGYDLEWAELIDFFDSLNAPVLIVSGDAHGHRLHEYPQKNLQTNVPRIVEFVSAGTEQNKFPNQTDPEFILKQAKGSGFGLVELGAEQDIGGQKTRTLTLTAVKTADGSPFWTASYAIVRGVGLFPLGI
jgi:hypothetical protein